MSVGAAPRSPRPSANGPKPVARIASLARHRRRDQGEAWDVDREAGAVRGDHEIAALHRPGRGGERAARDIIERAAGLEHWLLADHPFAAHRMLRAAAVRNEPFAADELDRLAAAILDADMIGPEPAAPARLGLLGKEAHRDPDGDVARGRGVGEQFFHARFLLRTA